MKNWIQRYKHILITGAIITILNLWLEFFLKSGTFFFLDVQFTPFTGWREWQSTSIWWYFSDSLKYVFGYVLASKLYLIVVYLIAIVAGIQFSRFAGARLGILTEREKLRDVLAILLVIYNPFFAERFMTQTGIALGGVLLLTGTLLLWGDKNSQTRILSGICFGVSWAIFPHAILLIALILLVSFIFEYKKYLSYITVGLITIALNLNWLMGEIFFSGQRVGQNIASFDWQNIEVFSSATLRGFPVELTHLLGYGFWAERYHIPTPDDLIPFWWIFALLILGIIIFGAYRLFLRERKLSYILFFLFGISYIVSLGISSSLVAPLNAWLYENIPYYIGMREPQKWLAVMMIPYSLWFLVGLGEIYQRTLLKKRYIQYIAASLSVLLIIAWSPQSLFAYTQQLRITDYPTSIWQARDFLEEHGGNTAIFPWHSYMACDWTRAIVTVNPSKNIFGNSPIIQADNIEVGNLYTNSDSPVSADIATYLKSKDLTLLEKNDIAYILRHNTCADFKSYDFLEENTDFETVFETPEINIYKILYEKK